MFKKIIVLLCILTLFMPIIAVYADEEIEDIDLTTTEIETISQASTEISKNPNINSRYAIVYDRVSRKSIIWKAGKQKMQNGLDHEDNDCNNYFRKCQRLK